MSHRHLQLKMPKQFFTSQKPALFRLPHLVNDTTRYPKAQIRNLNHTRPKTFHIYLLNPVTAITSIYKAHVSTFTYPYSPYPNVQMLLTQPQDSPIDTGLPASGVIAHPARYSVHSDKTSDLKISVVPHILKSEVSILKLEKGLFRTLLLPFQLHLLLFPQQSPESPDIPPTSCSAGMPLFLTTTPRHAFPIYSIFLLLICLHPLIFLNQFKCQLFLYSLERLKLFLLWDSSLGLLKHPAIIAL